MYVHGGKYLEPQESTRLRVAALPLLHGGVWKPWMAENEWTTLYQRQKTEQQKRLGEKESGIDELGLTEFTFDGELPEQTRLIHDEVEMSMKLRKVYLS